LETATGGGGAELSRLERGQREAAPRCQRLGRDVGFACSALVVRWLVSVRLVDAVKRALTVT